MVLKYIKYNQHFCQYRYKTKMTQLTGKIFSKIKSTGEKKGQNRNLEKNG
uniref:Uncharacterized protein n=1 Tax=Anguilla anguilla TaxID=7936 RepID=A0A0E9UG67_ANGAN